MELWPFIIFTIANVFATGVGYGMLTQKINSLCKRLDNGYTCKFHADIMKDVGRLQGTSGEKK